MTAWFWDFVLYLVIGFPSGIMWGLSALKFIGCSREVISRVWCINGSLFSSGII